MLESTSPTKDLSFVTVTYNNYEQLVATLESIKPVEPKEVIVVNGGQCKQTLDYLNSKADYFKPYFELKSISEPDKSPVDGMNKGILITTGKYINFMNSSDLVCKAEYFVQACSYLQQNPKIGFVTGDIVVTDGEDCYSYCVSNYGCPKTEMSSGFNHASIVYTKAVFLEVGLYSLEYKIIGDSEHFFRVCNKYKGHYIPDLPAAFFDLTGASSTDPFGVAFDNIKFFINNKKLLKNMNLVSSLLINSFTYKISRHLSGFSFFCKKLILLGMPNLKYSSIEYSSNLKKLKEMHQQYKRDLKRA